MLAVRPFFWPVTQYPIAGILQALEVSFCILGPEGEVMQSWATLLQKTGNRRIVVQRFKQLDLRAARVEKVGPHALGLNVFRLVWRGAKQNLKMLETGFDVADRYADVFKNHVETD